MATKREMLNAIANGTVNDEIMTWAKAEIEKMDVKNAARRTKVSPKQAENAELSAKIVAEVLGEEPMTATEIGAAVGISTQKASALMRMAVEAGNVSKIDVKVKGKGTQKGYVLV